MRQAQKPKNVADHTHLVAQQDDGDFGAVAQKHFAVNVLLPPLGRFERATIHHVEHHKSADRIAIIDTRQALEAILASQVPVLEQKKMRPWKPSQKPGPKHEVLQYWQSYQTCTFTISSSTFRVFKENSTPMVVWCSFDGGMLCT